MRKTLSMIGLVAMVAAGLQAAGHKTASPGVSPDEAWRMLSAGNERFARNLVLRPHADAEHRRELANGQAPWAAVVTCSDSRLAPEILFDQGLGDLFVVRDAGNSAKHATEVGSLEYAVEHLGTRLIVILGHSKCGAVTAAVKGVPKDDHSSIDELAAELKPAADEARDKVGGLSGAPLVEAAIERNVLMQMKQLLQASPVIAEMVEEGKVKVVGGIYDLENSRVNWLGEHPSEKAVIEGKKP